MIGKIVDKLKYKRKYTSMCVKYVALADEKIKELEDYNTALLQNMKYREELEKLKNEIAEYRKQFGKLKGGDKNGKNKGKR